MSDEPITTRDELEDAICEDAARITNELGYDWEELPGAIAWAAAFRLVYEIAPRLPNGPNTTLAEVASMLGADDV